MRKVWIIVIIAILLLAIGIVAGVYSYQKNNTQDSNIKGNSQLAVQKEQKTEQIINNVISTSAVEEKISPNCTLIEKQYFKGCDHLLRNIKDIPEEMINYSKADFEKEYQDWFLEDFSSNQIMLYQEKDGFCDKHYLVKENNGVLGIYTIDESGNEIWKEDTDIQTMYLPEEDLEKLKQGIEVLGDTELHTVLEDFE